MFEGPTGPAGIDQDRQALLKLLAGSSKFRGPYIRTIEGLTIPDYLQLEEHLEV